MEKILERLGSPQKELRVLHVAGSKGKGSTCAFLAEILRSAGYQVGLYTSPHFYDVRERIRILTPTQKPRRNDRFLEGCIPVADFDRLIKSLRPVLDEEIFIQRYGKPTYFEVLTAAALCYFYRRGVDFVVLETGLGGRLDATNITEAVVAGLTPISLEHTQILGRTLKSIAREKAAIIKKGQQVVIARQSAEALAVIQERCRRVGAKKTCLGKEIRFERFEFSLRGQVFVVTTPVRTYALVTMLAGGHQLENAAVAIGMVEALEGQGFVVGPEAIRRGVARATWPGRFEIVAQKPGVILDCAHNPHSMQVLAETLREIFPTQKVYLVLGLSSDKDWAGVCRKIFPAVDDVILTQAQHSRALVWSKRKVASLGLGKRARSTSNLAEAMHLLKNEAKAHEIILIAGSIFLVAEAREIFMKTMEGCW